MLITLVELWAQPFKIDQAVIAEDGVLQVTFPAQSNAYYLLLRGAATNITSFVSSAVMTSTNGMLTDPQPAAENAEMFYRVMNAPLGYQPLVIERISLAHNGCPRFEFEARPDCYYILLRGVLTNIAFPCSLAMDLGTAGTIVDPQPVTAHTNMFYRLLQVPLSAPLDSDSDGIDDVFELRNSSFLSPLNALDAALDQDGDFRSNLEEYLFSSTLTQPSLYSATLALSAIETAATNGGPSTFTLQANWSQTGSPPQSVKFYVHGQEIGAAVGPPFSLAVSNLPSGVHSVSAKAFFHGLAVNSDPLLLSVPTLPPSDPEVLVNPPLPTFDFKFNHAALIANNGTLWTWGGNPVGQLGIGSTGNVYVPTNASSTPDWKSVAVGNGVTLALKTNGTIWFAGSLTTNIGAGYFSQVGTAANWARVFVSSFYFATTNDTLFAVNSNGELWTWGYQSGFFPTNFAAPAITSLNKRCVGVSRFSGIINGPLFVTEDGGLYLRTNWFVISGGGTITPVSGYTPAVLTGRQDWLQAEFNAVGTNGLALKTDGSLWELTPNNNSIFTGFTQTPVLPGTRWKSISVDFLSHIFAIKDDGSLWRWGTTLQDGQLYGPPTLVPVDSQTGNSWIRVVVGFGSVLGLRQDGSLWQWGKLPLTEFPCFGPNPDTSILPIQLLRVPSDNYLAGSPNNETTLNSSANTFQPFSIDATGNLPVQFVVDSSGAATFSLPISVPPGTTGMQPSLAVTYSSHGGNGLVGMGGSLSGLSVITRAAKSIAQDGATDGVNFDGNDRFALDGQRLVAVSGVYGADGTEYRTEMESFSKIVSYGQAGNGPAYFRVWLKSGQIFDYGNTTDSRIEASGTNHVMVWAVNKISDRASNYVSFTYSEDNANGEYLPTRIDYGGNELAATPHYASVIFGHQERPDVVRGRVSIYPVQVRHRLTSIETYVQTSQVFRYLLTYDEGTGTGRSRLRAATLCDANGVCFPPTRFDDWQDVTSPFAFNIQSNALADDPGYWADINNYNFVSGDYNGDGFTDMLHLVGDNEFNIWLNKGDGTFALSKHNHPVNDPNNDDLRFFFLSGDFNGDGRSDLLHLHNDSTAEVWVPQASGNFNYVNVTLPGYDFDQNQARYYAGDWNGDGRTDVIHIADDHTAKVWLSQGNGTFSVIVEASPEYRITENDDNYFPSDLDGDGLTDLLHISDTNRYFVWLSEGNGHFTRITNYPPAGYNLRANDSKFMSGDYNGDGRTDFLHFYDLNTVYFWAGIGNGNFELTTISASQIYSSCQFTNGLNFEGQNKADFKFQIADFNGDGRTDVIHFFNNTDAFIWISNGDGTFRVSKAFPNAVGGYGLKGDAKYNFQLGDFNGDGKTDIVHFVDRHTIHTWLNAGPFPDLPTRITDGQGNTTSITYKPLTDPIYTPDTDATYPNQDMRGPMYVVSSHRLSDGQGGEYEIRQRYFGAKANLTGRGFLGFRSVQAMDMRDGLQTQTDYSQGFPFTGQVNNSMLRQLDGRAINQTTNTWTDNTVAGTPTRHFVYQSKSVARSYELDGSLITTTTTTNHYDSFGNADYVRVDSGDGFSKTTTSQFDNNTNTWVLGRVTRSQVTSVAPGQPTQSRLSGFGYYSNGQLQFEEIEPDLPAFRLRTDYEYDVYGNRIRATVSGNGITTRSTSTVYGSAGRFLLRTTNALNHVEAYQYDARFGVLTNSLGPNQLATGWRYDSFGRKVRETRADGTQTDWIYSLRDADAPPHATYKLQSITSGQPPTASYYDKLGRVLRSTAIGFNGETIFSDTEYDDKGRVARSSRPYFKGDSIYWSYFTYDLLGRTLTTRLPDNSVTSSRYQGLTTVVTNALNQRLTQIKNSQGQLVETIDHNNRHLHHEFDAFGNLVRTTDPANNAVTMDYDIRGRKTSMDDPDAGHWTYNYNVLGELLTQQDAKSQWLTNQYDLLGRLTRRIEPEGTNQWIYDTAFKGIGKLAAAAGPGGYARTNTYDSLGRPHATITAIAGQIYAVTNFYDSLSRVERVTYPSGVYLQNNFNSHGFLASVARNGTAQIWQANSINAAGQLTSETLGNGITTTRDYDPERGWIQNIQSGPGHTIQNLDYQFDLLGNLKQRRDLRQSLTENFAYDSLNRLTNAVITGRPGKSFQYDQLGNITNKSGVGAYVYGGNGGGPHAVSSAGGVQYFYDANGNQTEGNGRTVAYTSFNKPATISKGADSSVFSYDCEHARIIQTSTVSGVTTTTTYLGGLYEVVARGATVEQRHYFPAGGGLAAIYKRELAGTNVVSTSSRYPLDDHLGSIDTITDEAGNAVERFSYDPHGKRRDANWNDIPSGSLVSQNTERAFTGHLQLDSLDIIHMGGRIYDPVLGRMLNADPFVQSPGNLQAFNRYTYVINNPLTLTDPSGYFSFNNVQHFFREHGRRVGAIGAAALVSAATGGLPGALLGGATSGAISSRGDARAILISTAEAAAFFGVGEAFGHQVPFGSSDHILKIAGHGLVGGISQAVQGGKFSAGLTSAAFAQAAAPTIDDMPTVAARVTAAAVVGGYGSELGGGKFANGAMTGAFSRLFNDELKRSPNWRERAVTLDEGVIDSPDPFLDPVDYFAGAVSGLFNRAYNLGKLGVSKLRSLFLAENETFVYRGVHAGHPALENASKGRVTPGNVNGTVTSEAHNLGGLSSESPYTSWSHSLEEARYHALKQGEGGVILRLPTGTPPPKASWSWEWSPNEWGEHEVLLRGVREGATVLKP